MAYSMLWMMLNSKYQYNTESYSWGVARHKFCVITVCMEVFIKLSTKGWLSYKSKLMTYTRSLEIVEFSDENWYYKLAISKPTSKFGNCLVVLTGVQNKFFIKKTWGLQCIMIENRLFLGTRIMSLFAVFAVKKIESRVVTSNEWCSRKPDDASEALIPRCHENIQKVILEAQNQKKFMV